MSNAILHSNDVQKIAEAIANVLCDRIQQPLLAVGSRDAARMLGVSERTLYDLERDGRIRCTRVGAKKLYAVRELERFLEPSSNPSSNDSTLA